MINYLIFTIIGFLSGSILYCYWLPLIICNKNVFSNSIDGNPGTANAYKLGGFWIGTASLLLELLKGCIPTFAAGKYIDFNSLYCIPVIIAPVLGHAFPFFASKKGGKAIAVSFGVLIGLFPEVKPLLFLAISYLLFSLIIIINPHIFRSIITFSISCFFVVLSSTKIAIKISFFIITCITTYKHLIKYNNEKLSIKILKLNG